MQDSLTYGRTASFWKTIPHKEFWKMNKKICVWAFIRRSIEVFSWICSSRTDVLYHVSAKLNKNIKFTVSNKWHLLPRGSHVCCALQSFFLYLIKHLKWTAEPCNANKRVAIVGCSWLLFHRKYAMTEKHLKMIPSGHINLYKNIWAVN